jgi:hypothetical protein
MSFNDLSVWKRIASFTKCRIDLLISNFTSMKKISTMMLKLNSMSSFNVKLNRLEDFSWNWQWRQYLMKYSIAWEFTSWFDRSRIVYKRRVEKWSNRRWRRRNSMSMKKQEFWSRDFAINDCAEMFQRRNAWSYRRIIEWCSFFIFVWR